MLKNPPPGYTDEVIITEACGPSIREIMTKARIETGNTKLCSFSMDNIKRIGKQIGDAMLHLEKLKIFHLDLKASNVAFSRNFKYEMDTSLTHAIISMSDFDIKVIDYGNSLAHSESGNPEGVKLVQPQNMRASEVFMGGSSLQQKDGCLVLWMPDRPIGSAIGGVLFNSRKGDTQLEIQQSQFEMMIFRMNATISRETLEESKQRGKCSLNFDFLNDYKEVNNNREGNNNQDYLMEFMRDDTDLPLFEFLKFALKFDPAII
ncbi:Protein CBG08908 [Caenorhabditis briggsae]|uniref:Protein CBG08908 n=1 Tax=Caenorhabditis briggsae TaxID=6238 RepID=A8X7N4_CAEBR|nr:Protein CBG08908 [Caenorhabditis briggsae]CAP28645.1 Protein CBG08908 [Caenorhabditis briggsae]